MQAIIEAAMTGAAVGIAAGILAVLAAVPWKRDSQPCARFRVLAPLLIGAAYAATLIVTDGWKGIQPDESWRWLLNISAAAALVAAIAAAISDSWLLRLAAAVATAGLVAWLFHAPASVNEPMLWKAIVAASVFISWLAIEPLAGRRTGVTAPLGLGLVFIAAFLLLLDRMNFARAAPPLAAIAAALGMIAIGALIKPAIRIASGVVLAVLPIFYGSIASGWLAVRSYTELDWWVPLAVGASPLALWIGEIPMLRKVPAWLRVTITVGAAVLIAGGAIAFAALTAEPDPYAY